jgi:predicted DNA-binding transcriptional regulator AlpA
MPELHAVPSLDELAADPGKTSELSVTTVEALLARCHTLEGVLFARLLAARKNDHHPAVCEEDRLLTVAQAAKQLAETEDWLYRHARELPFTVRSGRHVRFSSKGIARYIRERQGL